MTSIYLIVNMIFSVIIGVYFYNLLKNQQGNKIVIEKESKIEIEKLKHMRDISLTTPLSEKTRPSSFKEIIGQDRGIKALKAALCSPNPQHVIIYGPPGIGKTAAARLVLEEAKKISTSPFKLYSKFIEIDATTVRFDDRGIADPLIGSVHDPIYQGAGAMGVAGIPQPKIGAVTRAHGGILFIDEIGELHPIEMNKLLKVMEDRKVFLDSVYYNKEDPNMPIHIKDMFDNGLPADFRLVGATTRNPEEIPPAIRSRCVEVFFRSLLPDEIEIISKNAVLKTGLTIDEEGVKTIGRYATNGREAVNIVQIAGGIVINDKRGSITLQDIEWVIENGQYNPRPEKKINPIPKIGCVNGLAVFGPGMGTIIEIEAAAIRVGNKEGKLTITGIIDEEETSTHSKKFKRKSMAKSSVENVMTVIRKYLNIEVKDYDIHLNFPGGSLVDGPSAGIAITCAIYSAIIGISIDNTIAMTGEISITGEVLPVGGVTAKIEAARKSGANKVLIPKDNYQESYNEMDIKVIPVESINEVIENVLQKSTINIQNINITFAEDKVLSASDINS